MDRTGNEDETTTEDETDDAGWTGRWRANRPRMFPVLPSSARGIVLERPARRVKGERGRGAGDDSERARMAALGAAPGSRRWIFQECNGARAS